MIRSEALLSAIERSYEAFAREPRPKRWRAAPHRDGDAKRLARGDGIASGFWDGVDISVRQQVSAWLLSDQVRHRLEVTLERVAGEDRREIEQGLSDLDQAR